MTLTPDVVAVLGAALLHTPTTIQGVSRACSLGECDHGDYADCPEVDIVVCEACHALVGDEDEVYPSEILADRCPVCVAVTAWRGAIVACDTADAEEQRKRRRRRLSEEELDRVAAAYADGGAQQVAREMKVGRRQASRYIGMALRAPVPVGVSGTEHASPTRTIWTAELDDGTEVLVETFDGRTFTIASRPRALAGLPWSPPTPLEPGQ